MTDDQQAAQPPSGAWLEFYPGSEINDRYVIEKMLGRGGIGAVFLATDRNLLGRRVVIKVLLDEISQSETGDYFRKKFAQEIAALARINHPGVVGIRDAGHTAHGRAFLVMEYVAGTTLREELDELRSHHINGMPFDCVAHITRQLGQALNAAHTRNIYHRDLKPENIMIEAISDSEQQVKIIDFGIASITDTQSGKLKTSTHIVGTIAYMAPEQFHGKPTRASDIFALGVIVYEMLTGWRPFNPPSMYQALDILKQGVRVKPSALRLDLPPAAEAIILRMLEYQAKDRPADAREVGEELARALSTESDVPFAEPSSEPATVPFGSPAAPPPRRTILTQTLNVVYHRDHRGQEGLRYTPQPLGDVVPPHALVRVQSQILQSYIEAVRLAADDLTRRALVNQRRGGKGIEQAAGELARYVLPEKGIAGIIGQGVHPQFDTYLDIASEIPWEALEESYYLCPNGHRGQPPARTDEAYQPFCERCGGQMRMAGGKLALAYHLTHLVHGSGRPGAEGRQFLFIEDPTGDLCNSEAEAGSFCANHLDELHQIIERHGYTINLLRGSNATARRVLKAIADPAVAAIYYFGHGYFPRDGDEGCLLLADAPLAASQIEAAAPVARFVFLNACEGAATGRNWDLDNRPRNVANAFAQGSLVKVVISPLLPVVSTQAAEAALEFFKHASLASACGEALRRARQMSFQRYEADEPHLVWMAYRYLGDPNKALPLPAEATLTIRPGEVVAPSPRVFDESRRINEEIFAFALDEVLFRAAKRRNLQARTTASMQDFIAGLLRKGDLTRHVLRKRGKDPDRLYEKIYEVKEESDLPAGEINEAMQALLDLSNLDFDGLSETKLREIFSRWVVTERKEIRPEVIAALEKADLRAQQRQEGDQRVSEQDVLECIIEDAAWRGLSAIGLLAADEFQQLLRERELTGEVNENGEITLDALDAEAKKIIETAHILSKQRGEFPIPNRLLLAAFLADEKRFASQVLLGAGYDLPAFFELILSTAEGNSPLNFGLSEEACSRVVMPVIEMAAHAMPDGHAISEAELFRAFCAKADPNFKEMLRQVEPEIDLDFILALLNLSPAARKVIDDAYALARQRGISPIPNRLLLAAFLTPPDGYVARLFRQRRMPPDRLRHQLIGASGGLTAKEFPLNRQACARIVLPTMERAKELAGGGEVNEEVLFKAFCDVSPPEFKQVFKQAGVDLDSFGSGIKPAAPAQAESSAHATRPEAAKTIAVAAEQFDEKSWQVLVESARLAETQGWAEIRTPHLFAALIGDGSGVMGRVLWRDHINPEEMRLLALDMVPPGPPLAAAPAGVNLGKHAQRVVSRAMQIAAAAGRSRVSEEDLAHAFLSDEQVIINELLRRLDTRVPPVEASAPRAARSSVLESLGTDLTEKARAGLLPEIVGRELEIETAMQTLLLTENANPLLVGEAGVGKTAIVEGIAQRIARGNCPQKLAAMRVMELSAGRLVANTRFRGEFEQRIQQVLEEARHGIILFIDEIHTIVGAGSAEDSGPDAGNMLKAALARGEMRLIGATTHAEYRRTIGRDRALSRRFQVQMIGAPSREATIAVLSARQKVLEAHHGVRITKGAKVAAVDLSGQFILEKHWPAKARDVLERACVVAITKKGARHGSPAVTAEHVAHVVSRQAGISLERVSTGELSALATLEDRLNHRIIGQPMAAHTVADAIRRGRRGLSPRNRPLGVFLFTGPPGVGKTGMAEALAEEVFGGNDCLIRFDMGEFTEPHSVARLIGAPPGYVGYDQGAPLVEQLRRHPYALLLFDEIEHAHADVLAVLLRLFSEGIITDGDGHIADARNSIIILTTNRPGPEEARRPGFTPGSGAAEASSQAGLRSLLERHLPGKFIDRIDAIICFNPLTIDDLTEIARMAIADVVARAIAIHKVAIEVDAEAARRIAEQAARERAGARGVQRVVDARIAVPLGALLTGKPLHGGLKIQIAVSGDAVEVKAVTGLAQQAVIPETQPRNVKEDNR